MAKQYLLDVNKAIENSLTLDEYFIIHALHNNAEETMIAYTKNNRINTKSFEKLKLNGYINYDQEHENKLYFELLSLTNKGKSIVDRVPLEEHNFEIFRAFYPTKVTHDFVVRRLHGNQVRCRKLYDKLLLETTHNDLCKCLQLYVNEQLKNNNGIYMKNLETWLSQKIYLDYIKDVEQNIPSNINQSEDI